MRDPTIAKDSSSANGVTNYKADQRQLMAMLHKRRASFVGYAVKWGLGPEDAEDMVQRAVVKALQSLGQFDGYSHLSTWFHSILKRLIIDDWRRHRRHPLVSLDESLESDDSSARSALPDPLQAYVRKQTNTRVRRALGALSHKDREIIGAILIQGMEYKEASLALGIHPTTVGTRLLRARENFMRCYRKLGV